MVGAMRLTCLSNYLLQYVVDLHSFFEKSSELSAQGSTEFSLDNSEMGSEQGF